MSGLETLPPALQSALAAVEDPEVPVTLVDLGVLREATMDGRQLQLVVRPTRLSCPGRECIARDLAAAVADVDPELVVHVEWEAAPWTEADVSDGGKQALEKFGYTLLLGRPPRCPYCCGEDVRRDGAFGGAACKTPFTCRRCGSTFDSLRGALATPTEARLDPGSGALSRQRRRDSHDEEGA